MVKVWSGVDTSRLIRATLVDESTPPLRKAPTGTSAIKRFRTASCTRPRTRSTASSRSRGAVHAGPSSGGPVALDREGAVPVAREEMAGRAVCGFPRTCVRGSGTFENVRYWFSATKSSRRATSGCSSSAFISEANSSRPSTTV